LITRTDGPGCHPSQSTPASQQASQVSSNCCIIVTSRTQHRHAPFDTYVQLNVVGSALLSPPWSTLHTLIVNDTPLVGAVTVSRTGAEFGSGKDGTAEVAPTVLLSTGGKTLYTNDSCPGELSPVNCNLKVCVAVRENGSGGSSMVGGSGGTVSSHQSNDSAVPMFPASSTARDNRRYWGDNMTVMNPMCWHQQRSMSIV
jgi:hypothetical protein